MKICVFICNALHYFFEVSFYEMKKICCQFELRNRDFMPSENKSLGVSGVDGFKEASVLYSYLPQFQVQVTFQFSASITSSSNGIDIPNTVKNRTFWARKIKSNGMMSNVHYLLFFNNGIYSFWHYQF